MTQNDLDRAVAHVTGGDLGVIVGRGFVPLQPTPFDRESPKTQEEDDESLRMILKFPSPYPRKPAA